MITELLKKYVKPLSLELLYFFVPFGGCVCLCIICRFDIVLIGRQRGKLMLEVMLKPS